MMACMLFGVNVGEEKIWTLITEIIINFDNLFE